MTENAKPKNRKKNTKAKFYNLEGEEISSCYCRKCMKDRSPRYFYDANDELLDKSGYMSVCKDCISEVFMNFYSVGNNIKTAIFMTCKALNIAFLDSGVEATETWIENKMNQGKDFDGAFGFYKSKITGFVGMNPTMIKIFDDYNSSENIESIKDNPDVSEKDADYLIKFWGDGIAPEDYSFLENEYAGFKQTHKADTYAEITLMKEVCFTLLDIRNARTLKNSTAGLVKALQDTMKSLAISPSMALAGSKSSESFGEWIKDIEETTPAEWYENNELFKDVDNLIEYFNDFIVRPIKNFVTGSRDFSLTGSESENGENGEEDESVF